MRKKMNLTKNVLVKHKMICDRCIKSSWAGTVSPVDMSSF